MPVRVAETQDAVAITNLINAAFRQAESFFIDCDRVDCEVVQSLMDTGEFLVIDDGDTLAGCVYIELRGERAYLGLLSVDPQRQKAGLGSQLMTHAERYCAAAGCKLMDLRIVNLRTENHAFYSRRGYVETGIEPFPSNLSPKLPCHFVKMSKPLT